MSDNLKIYNSVRSVPENAKKQIKGGRLSGMTDINPMWRIKTLTEHFGACGFGWKYTIKNKHLEEGANEEIAAFVDVDLYIKIDGEWSEAIPGTGGSTFVAKERNGMYTSDECFKMALTDAISVACKALGVGADGYWEADRTKYNATESLNSDEKDRGNTNTRSAEKKPLNKATKAQITQLFQEGRKKEKEVEGYRFVDELKTMAATGVISSATPYGDKEGTIINWTVEDYEYIKEQLELPF